MKNQNVSRTFFYKTYIEKPNITKVKDIDLLSELSFYEELSIVKSDQAFEGYETSYKVEVIEKKDPLIQLKSSKSSKDLFNDSSKEKVELKKYKENEIEFSLVYFNSTTKTVINSKFHLHKSFQEFLYRIDNWINEG